MHMEKRSQWVLPVVLSIIVLVTGLGFYLLQQAELESRKQQAVQQLKISNELVADWIEEQRRLVGVWAHFPQVVEYAVELNQLPANRSDLVKQPAQVALRNFFSPLLKSRQIDGYAIVGRLGYVRASQRNNQLGLKSPIAQFPSVFSPLWKGRTQWLLPYNSPEPSRTEKGIYAKGQPQLLIASPVVSGHGMQAVLSFAINTQRELNQLLRNVLHEDVQAFQVFSREQLVMSSGEWQAPSTGQIAASWTGTRFPLEFKVLYKAQPLSQQLSVMHWVMLVTGSAALTGLILLSVIRLRTRKIVIDDDMLSELVYRQSQRGVLLLDRYGDILSYNIRAAEMLAGPNQVGKGEMHTLLLEFILTLQTNNGEAAPDLFRLLLGKNDQLYVGQWGSGDNTRWLSCRFKSHNTPIESIVIELDDVTQRRAQEMQQECRSRALDQAAELVFWVDQEGRIVFANQTAQAILEYTSEELDGLHLKDVDTSLSVDGWHLLWDRVRRGERVQLESRLMKRTGHSFPAESHMSFYQDGFNTYVCMFARDISVRKELEFELHRNSIQLADKLSVTSQELVVREAENEALLESLPDLLLVLNPRFELVNFQQPKSGPLLQQLHDGQSLFDLFPALSSDVLESVLISEECDADARYFCEVTRQIDQQNQILELRFARTSARKIMVLVRDITERKKQEFIQQFNNRLLTYISTMQTRFICNKEKLPDLMGQLHDLVALMQADYGCYQVTHHLKDQLACEPLAVIKAKQGNDLPESCYAEIQALSESYLVQWYNHDRPLRAEFFALGDVLDSQQWPEKIGSSPGIMLLPILSADEIQMMFTLVLTDSHGWSRDLTLLEPWIATCATILAGYDNDQERLLAEKKLQKEKQRAELASQAKTQFLSRMSHEFRTPLNAILGFGQLMEMDEESLNDEQRLHMQQIVNSGTEMLSLVDQILDLAQLESRQIAVELSAVDVGLILQECTRQYASRIDTKNLRLDLNLSSEVVNVQGNEKRLAQVINSLLDNAIEYTPDGGVLAVTLEQENGFGIFKVTDTGCGIENEFLDKIFMPFEAAQGIDAKGIGNGLALTRHLVMAMHGTIEVESEIGVGSCFIVSLPLANSSQKRGSLQQKVTHENGGVLSEESDVSSPLLNNIAATDPVSSNGDSVFKVADEILAQDRHGSTRDNVDREKERAQVIVFPGRHNNVGGPFHGISTLIGDSEPEDETNFNARGTDIGQNKFESEAFDHTVCDDWDNGAAQVDAELQDENNVPRSFDLIYIEDDSVSRHMLQQILQKCSGRVGQINVRQAADAEEGIGLFLDKSPDLLLLDMNLQGLSGSEVLQVIRSQPEGQEVPIVALSGRVEQEFIDQAFEQGFDDYLCKPLDVELLISVIERYRS